MVIVRVVSVVLSTGFVWEYRLVEKLIANPLSLPFGLGYLTVVAHFS
jgi:hypothetical protein